MAPYDSKDYHHLLSLALPALHASTPSAFSQGLQSGFLGVCSWLDADPKERKHRLAALQHCFNNSAVPLRQSRLLQLCSWPIFDKQILPLQAGQMPEFLWLFALPLTVEVALEHPTKTPVRLALSLAQRQSLVRLLQSDGVVNENAQLTVHNVALTLEDLQKLGPLNLAQEASKDCLGLPNDLETMAQPVVLDSEIESGRSFTWYVLCSARLPVGERRLLQHTTSFKHASAQLVFEHAAQEQSLRIQNMRAHRPIPLAETMMRCAQCGREELSITLAAAKAHYGVKQVRLRLPMEGVAELCAQHPSEPEAEYLLRLPFLVLEPMQAMELLLDELCEEAGLEFSGVYSVAMSPSSTLQ